MNMEYLLGLLIGLGVGGILLAIVLKITKKDGSIKCKYDERQQLVRGKGFKYAFFTLIIYNFLVTMLDSSMERQYVESGVLMITGVMIGAFVYAVYCIWNEGYFSLNENPKRVLIAFGVIALVNIGIGILSCIRGVVFVNGVLTINCMNLLCGILLLMIFFVVIVKWICRQREEE